MYIVYKYCNYTIRIECICVVQPMQVNCCELSIESAFWFGLQKRYKKPFLPLFLRRPKSFNLTSCVILRVIIFQDFQTNKVWFTFISKQKMKRTKAKKICAKSYVTNGKTFSSNWVVCVFFLRQCDCNQMIKGPISSSYAILWLIQLHRQKENTQKNAH